MLTEEAGGRSTVPGAAGQCRSPAEEVSAPASRERVAHHFGEHGGAEQ